MHTNVVFWRSLKTRVTLFTLGIFVLSIWTLAFYASRSLRVDLQRLLGNQQSAATRVIADEINRDLSARLAALGQAARAVAPAAMDNAAALQAHLAARPVLAGLFSGGVVAYRRDGTAIAEFPQGTGRVGINYADRDYIIGAVRDGKVTLGKPHASVSRAFPEFVIAAPVRDARGRVIGVLAGVTNLSAPGFLDRIARRGLDTSGEYLLVAPQHRLVVTSSKRYRIMATLPGPGANPWLDRAINGTEGSGVYVDERGVERLGSAQRVPATGWLVTASLPTSEAFAPVGALQQRVLLATVLLTLLAGVLTWWMLRRELAPLMATASALAVIAETHQPPQLLPVTRNDEIGALIGGFNSLLTALGRRDVALSQSERELQDSQRIARLGSYIFDIPVDAWRSSAMLDTIFGIGPDFARTAAGWLQIVHPAEQESMAAYLGEILAEHRRFDREYRIVRVDDGAERWVSGQGEVTYAAHGAPVRLVGTIRDITERKLADEQLRQSEESLAITLQSIGDAVIATDATGLVTRMNTTAERLTGWPLAEATGRPLPEVFCIVNALTRVRAVNPVQLVLERGAVVALANHTTLLARDGSEYQIADSAAPIRDAAGQCVGVVLVFSDVSEAYLVQRALESTTDMLERTGHMAQVGGWELDVRTSKLTWTRETCRIHDVDPRVQPLLEQAINFYAPEARPIIQGAVQDAIGDGTPFDLELPVITATGRAIWVRAQGHAVTQDGTAVQLVGAFQDITARRKAQDAAVTLEAQLQRAQKLESVGRLAGGVAHDFNNMMGVVLGNVDLALQQVDPALSLYADLLEIQKAAQRSADLTRQLLAYAREQPVEPVVLELNAAVPGLLSMLQRLLGEDIYLVWQPAAQLWPVKFDPSQLASVLTNLCINARDAIPDIGLITITTGNHVVDAAFCATCDDAAPGEYARLTVRDTGRGMDEATLVHIFEPFFTTKGVGEGTGLGLASVYGAVRQNGGFVTAASVVGEGTVFEIYLPRLADPGVVR